VGRSVTKVKIDVVSDVICPWCFLGKRRLDKALAALPDVEVEVNYRPYFLDPTIPPEGMDRRTYMEAKFGAERLKTIHDPLRKAGSEDGVPYEFDKISRTPNTLNAHRLLRWAHIEGVQQQVKEALMMAYWHDGRDIGNTSVLIEIAKTCGMDTDKVSRDLATDKDEKSVNEEVHHAQQIGITGVPTFIINQRYGVVGAQPVAALIQAIRQVASNEV
jgi:predicted DsbA family dithiol-disulfide isomerase